MKHYNIYVTSKPVIYDPAGRASENTLAKLGFSGIERLRIGKFIEMQCADDVSLESIKQMCDQLLANPVLEDFRIEIVD
ncbi:MAG: phosphoribosylformylglycinamidine synthase subunit PurS [Coriobacteriales bacterium]|jgi:phosphoribosylformylglycinamidine synthase|nr:phosphoribosylformylglycinamidine synthase subunit PurS [Coriobacteriales bacterium]